MLKVSNLKSAQEFEAQISPLSFDELQQLELNILRDRRLVDPIIVWNGYILDGHNRYAILRKHTFIEYEIRELELASRQEALVWICNHQLGRRNLTPERKKFLIGKRYEAEKQIDSNRGNQYTSARKDAGDQIDPQQNRSSRHVTRQRIAKETNTSEGYVQRAEKYMHGVEAAEDAVPGSKEEILSGHIKATDREICELAKIPEPQRPEAIAELQKPKKERDQSIILALPKTSEDEESFDSDGRRFVTGIAEKIQGKKKKLSKEDREALKKSVDGRYYREIGRAHV